VGHGSATIPEHVRDNQFGLGINCRPRPAITRAFSHLLWRHVLLLGIDEGPNFIALDAAHSEIANVGIVV
jgi:hypothetical protein